MAKPGPRPLPTSVKRARGTLQRCRTNPNESAPKPGTPAAPEWLGPDAKREWKRLVPLLAARGLLELLDRAALTGYVSAWGDLAEATRVIAEQGTTCIGARGQLLPHPELRRLEKARQTLRMFAAEFGLSPSARSRVVANAPARSDPADEARRLKFARLIPKALQR